MVGEQGEDAFDAVTETADWLTAGTIQLVGWNYTEKNIIALL
jgi:hypothetical protein